MDDPKQAVQLYQAPPSVMGPMADVLIDVDEHPDMMDPKKGKPFIVKKTGSGKNTRYTVQVSGKPASYDPKLLESVTDLQAVADRPKDVVAINELADRIRANSTF